MSNLVPEFIKDAFKPRSDEIRKYEKNITMIGVRGAGKTTALGCINLVCDIESTQNPNFTFQIDERTSGGIAQISADLCRGIFPRQTDPGHIYQADLYLTWKTGLWGNKTVHMRMAETAGEDIENLIGPYRGELYKTHKYRDAENLNEMIAASQGFIVTIAVPRSMMPIPQRLPDEEPETLHPDPDLNAFRILNAILKYKKEHRSSKCEGIAILLTKYDMVSAWLKQRGMSLYNPEGAKLFLSTWFRKTMGVLKNYGLEKVKFFPLHVQVEKEYDSEGNVHFLKWSEASRKTGFKIRVNSERNLPYFSERSCREVIDWMKEVFPD